MIATPQPGHIDRADWQVPAFEVFALRPREQRYCLVVPVLDEGERLLAQLRQTQAQGHARRLDVIVADGGSRDGSTTPSTLQALGVGTLLVKRGPGRLSAQLRMAYAYALQAGYEGVVTIDGNGKDGVEALPRFVAALDDGFDYAQASRFIAGGKALRTPLLRLLAIRALHAPVLSAAAGRHLTDTTQGYRAYSARYLLHPEVLPFRDVFQRYELLAYLSVRASQLGLRVTEIATRRCYPADGSVPTRIGAVSGHADLLRTLWHTVRRHYHPSPAEVDAAARRDEAPS